MLGFLTFFLLYSFRGRVEAHWVAFVCIPLVLLVFELIHQRPKWITIIKKTSLITLVLVLLVRIIIILDLPLKTEFHSNGADFHQKLKARFPDRQVIFTNSYQEASKHYFYTGDLSFSENNIMKRQSHYDLLPIENDLHGKKSVLIGLSSFGNEEVIELFPGKRTKTYKVDRFEILSKIKVAFKEEPFQLPRKGKTEFSINNPYNYPIDFNHAQYKKELQFYLRGDSGDYLIPLKPDEPLEIKAYQTIDKTLSWQLPDSIPNGHYQMFLVLQPDILKPKLVSGKYELEIKE